jgi:hypothetical protein
MTARPLSPGSWAARIGRAARIGPAAGARPRRTGPPPPPRIRDPAPSRTAPRHRQAAPGRDRWRSSRGPPRSSVDNAGRLRRTRPPVSRPDSAWTPAEGCDSADSATSGPRTSRLRHRGWTPQRPPSRCLIRADTARGDLPARSPPRTPRARTRPAPAAGRARANPPRVVGLQDRWRPGGGRHLPAGRGHRPA